MLSVQDNGHDADRARLCPVVVVPVGIVLLWGLCSRGDSAPVGIVLPWHMPLSAHRAVQGVEGERRHGAAPPFRPDTGCVPSARPQGPCLSPKDAKTHGIPGPGGSCPPSWEPCVPGELRVLLPGPHPGPSGAVGSRRLVQRVFLLKAFHPARGPGPRAACVCFSTVSWPCGLVRLWGCVLR